MKKLDQLKYKLTELSKINHNFNHKSPTLMIMSVFILISSMICLSWLVFFAKKYTIIPVVMDNIILIPTDMSAIRVKPDNPGGLVVHNKDKTIYEKINKNRKSIIKSPHSNEPKQASIFNVISGSSYSIQLATLKNQLLANKEKIRIEKKFYELKNLAVVQSNNLYIVKLTGLTKNDANVICKKLKANKQSCIIYDKN